MFKPRVNVQTATIDGQAVAIRNVDWAMGGSQYLATILTDSRVVHQVFRYSQKKGGWCKLPAGQLDFMKDRMVEAAMDDRNIR